MLKIEEREYLCDSGADLGDNEISYKIRGSGEQELPADNADMADNADL